MIVGFSGTALTSSAADTIGIGVGVFTDVNIPIISVSIGNYSSQAITSVSVSEIVNIGHNAGIDFSSGAFVIGGLYGTAPNLSSTDHYDIGQGRLIPNTVSDQMIGTVLKWWGIPQQHLNLVLPNLDKFSTKVIPNIL